jgi:hypothetical protein
MTHEDSLRENGYTICSPISGSMKTVILSSMDCALFAQPQRIRR